MKFIGAALFLFFGLVAGWISRAHLFPTTCPVIQNLSARCNLTAGIISGIAAAVLIIIAGKYLFSRKI